MNPLASCRFTARQEPRPPEIRLALSSGSAVSSVTDSAGNTYTVDVNISTSAGSPLMRTVIFSSRLTTALTSGQSITVNFSGAPSAVAASISEFTGIAGSLILDKAKTRIGNSSSPNTTNTTTTAQAKETALRVHRYQQRKALIAMMDCRQAADNCQRDASLRESVCNVSRALANFDSGTCCPCTAATILSMVAIEAAASMSFMVMMRPGSTDSKLATKEPKQSTTNPTHVTAALPRHIETFVTAWLAERAGSHHSALARHKIAKDVRAPVEQMLSLVIKDFRGRGRPHKPRRPFVEAAPGFFDYLCEERGLRDNTVRQYAHQLRRFAAYLKTTGIVLLRVPGNRRV
ncbi:MAG: hypothetical protein FJ271_29080 [Planctomycetes bacterium]|nr:hypothetical protein [Planctomycetota bacterium]